MGRWRPAWNLLDLAPEQWKPSPHWQPPSRKLNSPRQASEQGRGHWAGSWVQPGASVAGRVQGFRWAGQGAVGQPGSQQTSGPERGL